MLKKTKIAIFLVLLLVASGTLSAQSSSGLSLSPETLLKDEMTSSLSDETKLAGESQLLGDVVEAEYYKVGPGDILGYYNFSSSSKMQYVTVSPECSIFVPRMGEIDVRGMTLAEVKKAVVALVAQKQPNATVSVSLYKPRIVMITLSGNTLDPGVYIFPASYRISTAINAAKKSKEANSTNPTLNYSYEVSISQQKQINSKLFGGSTAERISYGERNIRVERRDGAVVVADPVKAKICNDIALDPYIAENDKIIIPYDDNSASFVSVGGAVMKPGLIPWKQGDRVSDIFKMAGGVSADADLSKAILKDGDGSSTELSFSASGEISNDREISGGSGISIGFKHQSAVKGDAPAFVTIKGEVENPGVYEIVAGQTKIKDIIDMAGGFTKEAYLPLASIMRNDGKAEISRTNSAYYDFFRTSDLSMYDSARVKNSLSVVMPTVSCNLAELYTDTNETANNVALQNGDYISIPKSPKTVYIFGYVKNPGYIDFQEGKTLDWYLSKAGGVSKGGKKNRARIIRGNNGTWAANDKDTFVYAGDQIYVPTSPDLPPGTEIQTYSLIVTALVSVISVTITILNFFKY